MKKPVLLCVSALLCAALVLTGCGKQEDTPDVDVTVYENQIAALQAENDALRTEVQELKEQLNSLQATVLADWTLSAIPSSDRTHATVTFSAAPVGSGEGQSASLVVTLNGLEAESVSCVYDGARFTATVDLPAADGYNYYCLLTSQEGTKKITLYDDPEVSPLVNLGSSMTAYCSLFLEDWEQKDNQLVLKSAFITAQMPLLGGESMDATEAELIFLHNGQEVSRKTLTLEQGEGNGSYQLAIQDLAFDLPKMEDEHQLDLLLQVPLSNGSAISYNGCSWYWGDGALNPVFG